MTPCSLRTIFTKTDVNHEPTSRLTSNHEGLNDRLMSYRFGRQIGTGTYGSVRLAEVFSRHRRRDKLVAIKVVRRSKLSNDILKSHAISEVDNLVHISTTGSKFFICLKEAFCDAHNLYLAIVCVFSIS